MKNRIEHISIGKAKTTAVIMVVCLVLSFIFVSCSGMTVNRASKVIITVPDITVNADDTTLKVENGVCYFQGMPFSGYIAVNYPNGNKSELDSYFNGFKEGVSYEWYPNGVMHSERKYHNGEKSGTHYGWYDDGSKYFERNFNYGLEEGESFQWYRSGKLYSDAIYKDGKELSVKAWNENSKPVMNYKVKDGVIYGLNNSSLCYTLKNERGEYAAKK